MWLKSSLCFQAPFLICLSGWAIFIPRFFCATTTCTPPDFPSEGSYAPNFTEYEVGMRVIYYCNDRFKMFGEDRITCLSTGRWSGKTPFCDSPTKLKNPIASSRETNSKESSVIDGSLNTCFHTGKNTGETLRVFLDRPAVVYSVMLHLPKGKHKFTIVLSGERQTKKMDCQSYGAELADKEWVRFFCKDTTGKAESIILQDNSDKASVFSLCEIEVYTKDDDWCENPPENYLTSSQLEISRNKASFTCNQGYKAKDSRRVYATCESNSWSRLPVQCTEILCVPLTENADRSEGIWDIEGKTSKLSVGTKSSLKCKPGYHPEGKPTTVTCLASGKWNQTTATCKKDKAQKDSKTIIAVVVGTVVVLVIFILLGLTIYFVQKKSREVVVIYKPSEDNSYSTPPSIGGHSTTALSEAEYSTVYYEAIQNNQFDPRTPPPKPPNLIPRLERGYSKPVDERSVYNTARTNKTPTDLAFGTLTKSSSLYDTMN